MLRRNRSTLFSALSGALTLAAFGLFTSAPSLAQAMKPTVVVAEVDYTTYNFDKSPCRKVVGKIGTQYVTATADMLGIITDHDMHTLACTVYFPNVPLPNKNGDETQPLVVTWPGGTKTFTITNEDYFYTTHFPTIMAGPSPSKGTGPVPLGASGSATTGGTKHGTHKRKHH